MMHHFRLTLALLGTRLLFATAALAQPAETPAASVPTIEYFDAEGKRQPSAEGAHHRVETLKRGKGAGTVTIYYPSGKPRSVTSYAYIASQFRHGPATTYYENGQVRTQEQFTEGKRTGELLVFYEDGKPKRRENYQAGVLAEGECYGPDGKPTRCRPYEVRPTYQGGREAEIVGAIQRSVKYPPEALRTRTQGRVFVSFEVNELGRVQQVRIVKGLSVELDDEVMRAVLGLGKFTPGTLDGESVTASFTLPITFRIE